MYVCLHTCICSFVHLEVKGQPHFFFKTLSPGHSMNRVWRTARVSLGTWAQLEQSPEPHSSWHPQCWAHRHSAISRFLSGLGDPTHVFLPTKQAQTRLSSQYWDYKPFTESFGESQRAVIIWQQEMLLNLLSKIKKDCEVIRIKLLNK